MNYYFQNFSKKPFSLFITIILTFFTFNLAYSEVLSNLERFGGENPQLKDAICILQVLTNNCQCLNGEKPEIENRVKNGDFTNGDTDWKLYDHVGESAELLCSETAQITIKNPGTENWFIQFYQNGISLLHGKTYKVSFDYRSIITTSFDFTIEQDGGAYTKYLNGQYANLSSNQTVKKFSQEFTMTTTDNNSKLAFLLGKAVKGAVITIDNVVLEKLGSENDPNYPSDSEDTWEPGLGWHLKWADEFDNAELNANNWTFQVEPAGKFNNEWQAYTNNPENCYVLMDKDGNDGMMVIEAIYNGEGLAPGNFTSARMITHNKQVVKYGKIAARIQVPYGKGLWPAFWMLGSNISENEGGTVNWPFCGEIDIMEMVGGGENEKIAHGSIHFWHDDDNAYKSLTEAITLSENLSYDFHVYEIEWDENSIVWKVDDVEYHTLDITNSIFNEFREDFYILLNVAVGGNWPGYPDNTTVFSQYMFVDWVRVYEK